MFSIAGKHIATKNVDNDWRISGRLLDQTVKDIAFPRDVYLYLMDLGITGELHGSTIVNLRLSGQPVTSVIQRHKDDSTCFARIHPP